MEVWTTEPGVQFYSAIGLNGSIKGKGGVAYQKYGALVSRDAALSGLAEPA